MIHTHGGTGHLNTPENKGLTKEPEPPTNKEGTKKKADFADTIKKGDGTEKVEKVDTIKKELNTN